MVCHDFLKEKLPAAIFEKIAVGVDFAEIKKGGGTRRFFRTLWEGVPAVVCVYDDSKAENFLYAGIADFLERIGVPAPRVFFHDMDARFLVMQDLGNVDLWTLAENRSSERLPAYQSALKNIAKLHRAGLASPNVPEIMRDGFNADYYKWEHDYFLTHAAKEAHKLCITGSARTDLERELASLAGRLLAQPAQLVHRDFQSQNILWHGNCAYFIDFQGMRVGTGWYDVASLLFDPYVQLSEAERDALFDFYCEETGVPARSQSAAKIVFYSAATQRLMQAIGAYFFLSMKMGKPHFRAFALPALESLKIVSKRAGALSGVNMLATELCSREKRRAQLL